MYTGGYFFRGHSVGMPERGNGGAMLADGATVDYRYRGEQETQLSLTNRATHLCNMQWHGGPPKTRSFPRVTLPNVVILR